MATGPVPLEEAQKKEAVVVAPKAAPAPVVEAAAPAGLPAFLRPSAGAMSSEAEKRERREAQKEREKEEEPR